MLGNAAIMMNVRMREVTAAQLELHGELEPLPSWYANGTGRAPCHQGLDLGSGLLVERVTCGRWHGRNHFPGIVKTLIFGQLDGERLPGGERHLERGIIVIDAGVAHIETG